MAAATARVMDGGRAFASEDTVGICEGGEGLHLLAQGDAVVPEADAALRKGDPEFRTRAQAWVRDLWEAKDRRIEEIRLQLSARKAGSDALA